MSSKIVKVLGKTMFRNNEGKLIELPSDITAEEAIKLEADALQAQTKVGKGAPPKPVPDVTKPPEQPKKGKAAEKGKKGSKKKGAGGGKPGGRASATLKAVGTGKVAQYLAAKALPVLGRGFNRLQKLRTNEQTHDDAAEKRAQADAAVVIPPSDGQSKSNAGQVNSVSARPAPVVDPNKGKLVFQSKLQENVPKKVEDVDNFKRDKKAQHVGADVMEVVQGDKNAVVSTFQDVGQTPPPAPREYEPETLPPIEPAPGTATMNLGKDAIAPLQKEHTDVSKYTNEADSKLKEEGVTQEQLDMVDSGDLANANKEKKGMEKAANEEPAAIQKFSQEQTKKVDQDLKQQETKQRSAVTAKRKAGLNATAQKQKGAKSALEKKREEVAAKINGMYQTAQDSVKKKLADLEVQSMKRFDDGNNKATTKFEADVNKELAAFKADRYSGWFGWARRMKDWWKGMDDLPAVKAIFENNRAIFVTTIDGLVAAISADNKRVVQECKDELTAARTKIKEYVDSLEPSLKDIGNKTAEEMNSKLEEMDKFVAKREEELQNQLKDKQTAAIKAIDEKIEKMKEAMAGALAKLGKLLLWAAKKFFTWALEKFGFSLSEIEGIINKGAAVLKAIFTKPIQFVKNLIGAAKLGFSNFAEHFLDHLKDAVFEWLTGSLQGVKLPQTWDLKGIAGLIFELVGISYQNLKKFLVKYIPAPVVEGLETTFTLIQTLRRDGMMAAWEQLKEMATEMKNAFITAVSDWIKWTIVKEAIKTAIAAFTPGAGIIRAIIGIYDTVVFFIQKAKDIMKMIGNFLNSISEIAAGNIGAAAQALENGLARGLVLVIDFLARLIKLTGVTNAIKKVLDKIRGKVDGVLDKVAKWVADKAKALIKKGVTTVKAGAAKILNWWRAKAKFTAEDGEHTLSVEGSAQKPYLQIASVPQSLRAYLTKNLTAAKMASIEPLMKAVEDEVTHVKPGEKDEDAQQRVQARLDALKAALPGALNLGIPLTVVVSQPGALATRVLAKPLTKMAGNTTPSDATSSLMSHSAALAGQKLMLQLNTVKKGGAGWSRLHLLSFRLMGPNAWWNLTPGDANANAAMKTVELASEKLLKGNKLKEITGKRRRTFIRFYEVNVGYHTATKPPGASHFVDSVTIRHGIFDPVSNEELDVEKPHVPASAVPLSPGVVAKPNFSGMGGTNLNVLLGKQPNPLGGTFPETIGAMIVMARTKMRDKVAPGDTGWNFSFERLRTYGAGIVKSDDIEGLITMVRNGDAEIK
jgi:hypothetical protein